MTNRIQILPTYLANQIAAGEVVERPASVLKELLENSLDAGSTQLDITIERAGIGMIQVQDNGAGICKEDLVLTICPHATSKIIHASDLDAITSYGFRGEALASISAISQLKITSWVKDQDTGWYLATSGRNTTPEIMPSAKHIGTCVEVKNLFFNTPVRRNFLRADKTELLYVEEVFKRIALSQPQVVFKWQIDERNPKRFAKCIDLEAHTKRVAQLCGRQFAKDAVYIEAEANGLSLKGWLGDPQKMRAQADLQYFYVNNRIVRDKIVMHAIRQAYQNLGAVGKHPAYVLYLTIDPAAVDVNVHPTKHEVRFRESRTVHAFLQYATKEALQKGGKVAMNLPECEQRRDEMFFPNFEGSGQKRVSSNLGELIAVLGESFILAEKENHLILVDIKATRTALTEVRLQNECNKCDIKQRALLLPKVVEFPLGIDPTTIEWDSWGFELTQSGKHTFLLRAVPELLANSLVGIETLLVNIIKSRDKIQCMANYVAAQSFSRNDNEKLLLELEETKEIYQNNHYLKCYKAIAFSELKEWCS